MARIATKKKHTLESHAVGGCALDVRLDVRWIFVRCASDVRWMCVGCALDVALDVRWMCVGFA